MVNSKIMVNLKIVVSCVKIENCDNIEEEKYLKSLVGNHNNDILDFCINKCVSRIRFCLLQMVL